LTSREAAAANSVQLLAFAPSGNAVNHFEFSISWNLGVFELLGEFRVARHVEIWLFPYFYSPRMVHGVALRGFSLDRDFQLRADARSYVLPPLRG
jgi:hypothetical protein